MRCPSCGYEIPAFAPTCPGCGWDVRARPADEVPVGGYGELQLDAATQAAAPSAEDGAVAPAAPRWRRGLTVLIGILALALIGGGVAVAGGYFGWYGGGGRHPSDVLPGSAVAYLQIDLNPSPAQKVQAWGFLRDLPEVRNFVGVGGPDPKRLAWDLFKERIPVVDEAADYDRDVAPWLGDRLGFGLVRKDQDAVLVIAIQVTDEAKGAAKLREWIASSQQAYAVTTRDGYALITTTEAAGFVSGELAKGVLSANPAFATDLGSVGETGMMAGWSDLAGLSRITYGYTDDRSGDVQGRAAFALRFSPDAMEFAGKLVGWNYPSVTDAGELGNLPASTGAAISVSGGAPGLKLAAPWLGITADSWKSQFGVDEADVAALLGRNLSISVPSSSLADSSSSQPTIGLRVVSDDAPRAQRVLHKVLTGGLLRSTLASDRVDGNVLTAASNQAYLEELARSKDKLSGVALFTRAVPDHVKAVSAVYVNLERILAHSVNVGSPYEPFVKALRAVGGEYLDEGSGNGSWLVRLVRT